MDRLRGEDEDAYPRWKEELLEAIRQMEIFADGIRRDYLSPLQKSEEQYK